jgi:hypothetical protein
VKKLPSRRQLKKNQQIKNCVDIELKMALTLQLMHEETSLIKKRSYSEILSGILTKYKETITGQSETYHDS